jgi:hypothetical protein
MSKLIIVRMGGACLATIKRGADLVGKLWNPGDNIRCAGLDITVPANSVGMQLLSSSAPVSVDVQYQPGSLREGSRGYATPHIVADGRECALMVHVFSAYNKPVVFPAGLANIIIGATGPLTESAIPLVRGTVAEAACKACGKPNDVGVRKCWNCECVLG